MNRTRLWQTATAGLAIATLLTVTAGSAAAQLPDLPLPGLPGGDEEGDDADDASDDRVSGAIPETGMGGFTGFAEAQGTTVFVGLPGALADPLAPVLDALGVAGSMTVGDRTLSGLRIDLAQVQADLQRAATGEEVTSEASALLTNLLLGSGAVDQPGACQGAPAEVPLPPDAEVPLLTLTVLGIDCEETEERAYASAQIAGLDLRLAALLELGLPDEVADGVETLIETLNEQLLTPVSDGLCQVLDGLLGVLLPDATPCEDGNPLLQLRNPLDLDVPIVDLDLVAATSEVVQDGDTVTATATSTFTGLNVLGVACLGQDGNEPLTFTSTASSDGATATREASAPTLALRLCQQEQSLLRILLGEGPLGDIRVFEEIVQDGLLDGVLQPVFDGVDQLLTALTTEALTQGSAELGEVEGAGTTARTEPFVAASTLPLAGLPGLGDVLGEVAVVVAGGGTEVGVNAAPAAPEPEPEPTPDPEPTPEQLPRTGAGAGALLGLAALGTAAALRRRDG